MEVTIALPATIPGLVRRGSPCLYHGQRVHSCLLLSPKFQESDCIISFLRRDGSAETSYAPPENLSLDLTDPTGFHHALLWLAEKLGMDASAGVLWYWDAEWGTWCLQAKQRGRRYVVVDWRAAPCGAMEIPPASQEVSPAESLRLAVLAVAGVEG